MHHTSILNEMGLDKVNDLDVSSTGNRPDIVPARSGSTKVVV